MLRKSIQIQNNVISEESRLVVARGWVGGVGDQEHEANVASSLYVLILNPLMLFWIHTCVRPYWTAQFRRGFFFFLNLICTSMKLWLKQHRVKDMKHRFPQVLLTVEAPGALESPHPWSPMQGVRGAPGQLCFLQGCQEFSGSGNGKPSYQIGDSWEGAFPPLDQTIIRWSLWFSSVSYRSIVGKYCITWVCHESLCEGDFSAPSILDYWITWEKPYLHLG